jgi:carbon-monoxide dehydrogenase large subunit
MSEKPQFSVLDRPNSYIGRSVPRPNARRLLAGRGQYPTDVSLPRMVQVAFARSPFAHARITSVDTEAARQAPGVVGVFTGEDIAKVCQPWIGTLDHFAGMKSAPQYPLARDVVRWQGEPVVAVVAQTRALAEDALEMLLIDYEELPAVTDPETALDPETPLIHPDLGDNLVFSSKVDSGDIDSAFAEADLVVEDEFHFGRHTGVTLEPRVVVADYDPSEERLTAYHGTQTPYQMQDVYARHLGLAEENVRVMVKDIGGAFGIKLHVHGEEMTTCALSIMLKRPVKWTADRLESFASDIHARDHRVRARLALTKEGRILGYDVDDLTGVGAYSVYPRTSVVEGNQVIKLVGAPYTQQHYRAALKVVLQNKNVMSQYRAVGHPIAFAVTEALVDKAAAELGLDPLDLRALNYVSDDAYPYKTASGFTYEGLSLQRSLEKLKDMIDYQGLREEQSELRKKGIYRGIGIGTFVEITAPGAAFYGVGGARISSQDGCSMKLEPSGKVQLAVSINELGQGTETIVAQIAATELGITMEDISVVTGDTGATPYGGAAWASRAAAIGGEATLRAARALRESILEVAGVTLQSSPSELDLRDGFVVSSEDGEERISLAEVGRIAYFRSDTLPPGFQPQLSVVRHYSPQGLPFAFTNGVHASYVEVDGDTGLVRLLKHWVVEDCGRVLNPKLVDEQARGGVAQGIGMALFEECLYSSDGQLTNGSLADYLVPLSSELPDIEVAHIETPSLSSEIGAKGAGEAGTAASPAAIMNAVNDAIAPLGGRITAMPMTPERILRSLKRI